MPADTDAVEATILRLLASRAPDASICPSEAARALVDDGPGWRVLMPAVREEARALARRGLVVVSQRGMACDPGTPWRGPVRLRRGRAFPA